MSKRKPQREPAYFVALLSRLSAEEGQPVVIVTHVFHDENCSHWRGEPCDCRPDITTEPMADWLGRGSPGRSASAADDRTGTLIWHRKS